MQRRLYFSLAREFVPGFLLGTSVFLTILLVLQFVRLAELFLIHNVGFNQVFSILIDLSQSFLPTLIPIGGLFGSSITLSRMSQDNEIVSMFAIGVSPHHLLTFFSTIGFLIFLLTAYLIFFLSPKAQENFEKSLFQITRSKIQSQIKENVFSNEFDRLILYTQKINNSSGEMQRIFLFDETTTPPIVILAQSGILKKETAENKEILKLNMNSGAIHLQSHGHTKIEFSQYAAQILEVALNQNFNRNPSNWDLNELLLHWNNTDYLSTQAAIEFHKRLSMSGAGWILTIFGFLAALQINRRVQSSSFALVTLVTASYWILLSLGEFLARKQITHPILALWAANILYACLGVYFYLKKVKGYSFFG